jgi:hypothetical protein
MEYNRSCGAPIGRFLAMAAVFLPEPSESLLR